MQKPETTTLVSTITSISTVVQTSTIVLTETTTFTTTISPNQTMPFIFIVKSDGRCAYSNEKNQLTFERKGEYVLLRYSQMTNIPCFRHLIENYVILKRNPPIVNITLGTEATSQYCIECIGLIETVLQIGPIPIGTDIIVNGLIVTT